MAMIDDATRRAFHAAHYDVAWQTGWLTLTSGTPCPAELTPWLSRHAGDTPAWLVTACNPGAHQATAQENQARQRMLHDWARAHAGQWLASVNRDPEGHWPDEPGLLIAGIEEGMARNLARRLDQLAIVAVRPKISPEIIWIWN